MSLLFFVNYQLQKLIKILLNFLPKKEKDFEIEVVNTNGQSLSKIHTGTISKAIIQIPAEVFAQGMYSVKISDGTQTKAFKVTK